jgi:hypothetical protein
MHLLGVIAVDKIPEAHLVLPIKVQPRHGAKTHQAKAMIAITPAFLRRQIQAMTPRGIQVLSKIVTPMHKLVPNGPISAQAEIPV